MSQLIALIIAIALGAIITAISFVYFGDAFTKNAARGEAISLASSVSQISMAITAYEAENAKSPFTTDYTGTMNVLVTENYLKSVPKADKGTFKAYQDGSSIFVVVDDLIATGISQEVCIEINKQSGLTDDDGDLISGFTDADTDNIPEATIANGANANAALSNSAFGCFEDAGTATKYVFVYDAG